MSRRTVRGRFGRIATIIRCRTHLREQRTIAASRHALRIELLEPRCLLAADLFPMAEALSGDVLPAEPILGVAPVYDPDRDGEIPNDVRLANQPLAPPFPLADTFKLHTRPGANQVIYLDFDGHTTTNTIWNTNFNEGQPFATPAYSIEGNSSFSNAELERIQNIWERVAEDFLPFNVDVTTEDPGVEALRKSGAADTQWGIRVCIGGSWNDWYGSSAGGVAYINSFVWNNDTPCFVFENNLGNGAEKTVAEAISHEAGHTLGLNHDGTSSVEYYSGHGSGATGWAPIMGVGYDRNLTQWSKGEYPNANRFQDDLSIITNASNGFGYRSDDHANVLDSATALQMVGVDLFGEGIIGRTSDVDYFSFTTGDGNVTLTIAPFYRGPNLDILATLYDASGEVIAMSNPLNELSASFNLQLAAGTYYVSVDGSGKPAGSDPGYSDYASLGYYSIAGHRQLPVVSTLVGVEFDVEGGSRPSNWTSYAGGTTSFLLDNLTNESGLATSLNLSFSTNGSGPNAVGNQINDATIPTHVQALGAVDGYLTEVGAAWTFVWSGLDPLSEYDVYTLGLNAGASAQEILVIGSGMPVGFSQILSPNDLVINSEAGASNRPLDSFAARIRASAVGTITLLVSGGESSVVALGGLAIQPVVPAAIAGRVWHDLDTSATMEPEEPGLGDWIVYLDQNADGQRLTAVNVEPDDFRAGTVLNDLVPGVTLRALGSTPTSVYAGVPTGTFTSTGLLGFTMVGSLGWGGNTRLRADFAELVDTVSIDAIGNGPLDVARIAAYDSNDNLVGTYTSGNLGPGQVETMTLSRHTADIAYIIVGGDAGQFVNLDNLRSSATDPSTTTDVNGGYEFEGLSPGDYIVRQELQPGWLQTYPGAVASEQHVVSVAAGEHRANLDFGATPLPQPMAGDYNQNGIVDAADAVVWRNSFGEIVAPFTGADGDGSGFVDENDRLVWMANFGRTVAATAAAIETGSDSRSDSPLITSHDSRSDTEPARLHSSAWAAVITGDAKFVFLTDPAPERPPQQVRCEESPVSASLRTSNLLLILPTLGSAHHEIPAEVSLLGRGGDSRTRGAAVDEALAEIGERGLLPALAASL